MRRRKRTPTTHPHFLHLRPQHLGVLGPSGNPPRRPSGPLLATQPHHWKAPRLALQGAWEHPHLLHPPPPLRPRPARKRRRPSAAG